MLSYFYVTIDRSLLEEIQFLLYLSISSKIR